MGCICDTALSCSGENEYGNVNHPNGYVTHEFIHNEFESKDVYDIEDKKLIKS